MTEHHGSPQRGDSWIEPWTLCPISSRPSCPVIRASRKWDVPFRRFTRNNLSRTKIGIYRLGLSEETDKYPGKGDSGVSRTGAACRSGHSGGAEYGSGGATAREHSGPETSDLALLDRTLLYDGPWGRGGWSPYWELRGPNIRSTGEVVCHSAASWDDMRARQSDGCLSWIGEG